MAEGNASKLESHPERDNLRMVAAYQRYLMLCLIAAMGTNVFIAVSLTQPFWLQVTAGLVSLAIGFCIVVVIYEIANRLTSSGAALLCSMLMFTPIVSIITLLAINQKATNYLKENGIRVGLTGAYPEDL
jgi:hypothetical protein